MMRSFTNLVLAVAALATLAGCGTSPVPGGVGPGAQSRAWSSPTTLLAVRGDVQRGLLFQRTVLGSDEVAIGQDRSSLDAVARRYRELSGSALAQARRSADLRGYASLIEAARGRDPQLSGAGRTLTTQELAWTVGEYHGAFQAVSDDIDARLGTTRPERKD